MSSALLLLYTSLTIALYLIQSSLFIQLFKELKADVTNFMVEDSGLEPLTSCVQGRRSPS